MKYLNVLLLLLIFATTTAHPYTRYFRKCRAPTSSPPSNSFCLTPPVVTIKDLSEVQGTYFLAYASGSALRFASDPCTTANYSLNAKGNIDVLNCGLPNKDEKPSCVRAELSSRVTKEVPESRLVVQFEGPPRPGNPGNYNVAAVKYKYRYGKREIEALAVYQCISSSSGNEAGFYIITKRIRRRASLLRYFASQLLCTGYGFCKEDFRQIKQSRRSCRYFTDGFNIRAPARPMQFELKAAQNLPKATNWFCVFRNLRHRYRNHRRSLW